MKAKTREKLAERGLGPGARRRRRGQGARAERRAAVRSESAGGAGAQVPDPGPPGAAEVAPERTEPVVRAVNGVGEVVDPPSGSVRERVRLRPAVSAALDVEAGRLGMTRESLCRFVLEEVARKAVEREDGAGEARHAVPVDSPAAQADAEAADSPRAIPGGYVGGGADHDPAATVSRVVGVVGESAPEPPADGAASLPAVRRRLTPRRIRRSAGWHVEPSRSGLGLGLGRYRRAQRRARWGALLVAVVVAAAACLWAGAGYWRYAVAGAAGDGVYVLDRWEGRVWRCASTRGAPTPACRAAVFRPSPVSGGDVARLGRAGN